MRPLTWTTNRGDQVDVYEAGDGFRYRVTARNSKNVEQGSEAYTRQDATIDAAERHHPNLDGLTDEQLATYAAAIEAIAGNLRGADPGTTGGEPT